MATELLVAPACMQYNWQVVYSSGDIALPQMQGDCSFHVIFIQVQ